jgi:hypothetical protein
MSQSEANFFERSGFVIPDLLVDKVGFVHHDTKQTYGLG